MMHGNMNIMSCEQLNWKHKHTSTMHTPISTTSLPKRSKININNQSDTQKKNPARHQKSRGKKERAGKQGKRGFKHHCANRQRLNANAGISERFAKKRKFAEANDRQP